MKLSATRKSGAQFDSGEIDAEGKERFQGFPGGGPFGGAGGGPWRISLWCG